jgi:hypothetical protein
MVDLLLLFPPQWSPFQPPLSLPSLSAWLKRAGFTTRSLDANIALYEWLLSEHTARLLSTAVQNSALSNAEKRGYISIFSKAGQFRHDVQGIRQYSERSFPGPHRLIKKRIILVSSRLKLISVQFPLLLTDLLFLPIVFSSTAGI